MNEPTDNSSAPADRRAQRAPSAAGDGGTTGFDEMGLPAPIDPKWGHIPQDHFGYASDEERRAKRGMEDWELVSQIPASQKRVPYWFIAVVVIVLLVGVGLGFPFWGQRKGVHIPWFNWGFVAAILYVGLAATFVYFMTNIYGSERAGRLDDDPEGKDAPHDGDSGTR